MNPTPPPSRTQMIQRLADGELSAPERSAMLQTIDDETPELWRDVALGLLGNRLVAEGLREIIPAGPVIAPAENVMAFPLWKRLSALAAALVIGAGIGFLAPQQRHSGLVADGQAVEDSRPASGLQNMLAAGASGHGADRPRPMPRNPEPESVSPALAPIGATTKDEGGEPKGDEATSATAPPKTVDPDQIEHKLRVTYGTEARATFKAGGDQRLKLRPDGEPNKTSAIIIAALKGTDATPVPVPGGGTRPYLVVTNGFDKPLHFRVLTRAKGSKEFIEAADFSQPVPHVGNHIVKCWRIGSLVEEVILYELTLSDDTGDAAGAKPVPSKKTP